LSSRADADRAILRALHRGGVIGAVGLACLDAARKVVGMIRDIDTMGDVALRVVPSDNATRLEFDIANRFESLVGRLSRAENFSAVRWGTVHENRRTVMWVEVQRTAAAQSGERSREVSPVVRTSGAGDPIQLLLDVTTRLARSSTLETVAEVVTGPLRAHLSADATALAVREGGILRFVHPAVGVGPTGTVLGHPSELSTAADTPIAATARDGITREYASSASVGHDFPAFGANLRAAHTQALAAVPLMVAGQSIGALAVGWRGARPVHRLRPLLTIVAMHTADATVRVTSPRPGSVATRPAGMRAPGSARRTLTEAGSLRLDLVSRSVFVRGHTDPIRLTGREFELLLYLVEHSGTTLSRHDTMRDVWGIDFGADTSVVDVTISRLRRKLGTSAIITVRDQGYMIR
jgi:hypothetical protein